MAGGTALAAWHRQRSWVGAGCAAAILGVVVLLGVFGRQITRVARSQQRLAAKNAELDVAHGQLDAILASLIQGVAFHTEADGLIV